ncbi:MAG: DUF853 family protein, partial [Deltaproteobacteria bacterium]|nr:DUF853 family protein [Deltaproteobacteria bacterium]
DYGNLATVTLASIQRQVLVLEEAGGDRFFGEPALKLEHILQKDFSGNGVVSVLDASSIMKDPRIYVSFMLYLMSELFEQLPEVGDLDRPKLVFFFDEAHLLFKDAPKVLLEKIEQVVRLIRSKGVGIYFVTQNPLDIPESVLAQLGNRVQHALRAFTPQDQKAVKVAAQTFRQNSSLNTEQVITELGVGEALVSTLDLQGTPSVVERTLIAPPESRIGPLTDAERAEKIQRSPIAGVYDQLIDRESAFELLKKRSEEAEQVSSEKEEKKEGESKLAGLGQAFLKSAAHAVGSSLGRQIMRGVMGSLLGGLTGGGRGRRKSLF